MSADTRPIYSRMPAHLEPIADLYFERIGRLIEEVRAEVLASSADRSPAELLNDARSLQSQVAAWAAFRFAMKIAAEKPGYPTVAVARVAIQDVLTRIEQALQLLDVAIASGGATRQ